jgi:N-acetylmuramoyl-L-alanine amidase
MAMIYCRGISFRRRRLLRSIFADNMRLLGKEPRSMWERLHVKPVVLGMFVFLVAFWLVDSTGPGIVRGKGLDLSGNEGASSLSPEPPPPEYSVLVGESIVSLKKLFGLQINTIMIDAGHGGDDPGAIGKMGTNEKDITIDIAKRLKTKLLKYRDYDILMTREKDETVSLKARADKSNMNGADLFVSIHVNYLPGRSKDIIETFYFGPSRNADTLMLAQLENKGSDYSLSDYNNIVRKLNYTLKLQESRLFATSIQENLYSNMRSMNDEVLDYGVKRAPFIVLVGANAPGVLVEVTCLSNRNEERLLNTQWYRDEIAKYIEEGIVKYLNSRSDT